jgi:t-SNARE complex subunit (syntaxin)
MTWWDVVRFISPVANAWTLRKEAFDIAQKKKATETGNPNAVPDDGEVDTVMEYVTSVRKYVWIILAIVIFVIVAYIWSTRRR